MKIQTSKANQTILTLNNGTEVFISYQTPVAAFVPGTGFLRTEEKFSATTSKHITQYAGKNAPTRPQSFFNSLI
jgi:hypothetical protein